MTGVQTCALPISVMSYHSTSSSLSSGIQAFRCEMKDGIRSNMQDSHRVNDDYMKSIAKISVPESVYGQTRKRIAGDRQKSNQQALIRNTDGFFLRYDVLYSVKKGEKDASNFDKEQRRQVRRNQPPSKMQNVHEEDDVLSTSSESHDDLAPVNESEKPYKNPYIPQPMGNVGLTSQLHPHPLLPTEVHKKGFEAAKSRLEGKHIKFAPPSLQVYPHGCVENNVYKTSGLSSSGPPPALVSGPFSGSGSKSQGTGVAAGYGHSASGGQKYVAPGGDDYGSSSSSDSDRRRHSGRRQGYNVPTPPRRDKDRDNKQQGDSNLPDLYRTISSAIADGFSQGQQNRSSRVEDHTILQEQERGVNDDYFLSFPAPWNVCPRQDCKRSDEQKRISMANIPKFQGNKKVNYFDWRSQVIEIIHMAYVSISEKITSIKNALDTSVPSLRVLFASSAFTPETYKFIIQELELTYGGADRAYDYALSSLVENSSHLSLGNLQEIRESKAKLQQFIQNCTQLGCVADINSRLTYSTVLSYLFDEKAELNYVQVCTQKGWARNLRTMVDWLNLRANDLAAVEQTNTMRKVRGVSKKPQKPGRQVLKSHGMNPSNASGSEKEETDNELEGAILSDVHDSDFSDKDEDFICQLVANGKKKFPKCEICADGSEHLFVRCKKFLALTPAERYSALTKLKRCIKCFSDKHSSARNCQSKKNCKECNGNHHSLLHFKKSGASKS